MCGRDDDRCVHARLLLQIPMAVIPIGAALPDREPIREALAGRDARKAQSGYAVHGRGQDHPVPVDRGRDVQPIVHADRDVLALAPPQHRSRHGAVDLRDPLFPARHVHRLFLDNQLVFSGERVAARAGYGQERE